MIARNMFKVLFAFCLGFAGLATFGQTAPTVAATIGVSANPFLQAVNPVTNTIYVVTGCGIGAECKMSDGPPASVTVINGATNTVTATVPVGYSALAIAVNPKTNQIYVVNRCGAVACVTGSQNFGTATVTVIDGATNTITATVPIGSQGPYSLDGAIPSSSLAVNSVTNQIYVVNGAGSSGSSSTVLNAVIGTVTVIDGATNTVAATVTVGYGAFDVAVNQTTNQIYVTNNCGSDSTCSSNGSVTVIDGNTNTVAATVSVQASPGDLAVNPATNQIYVVNTCGSDTGCVTANLGEGSVTVIDGATNTVAATIAVGLYPTFVVANPATNEIYVHNTCASSTTCDSDNDGPAGESVIDGATNTVATTVAVGYGLNVPIFSLLALDPTSNQIYVIDECGSSPCPLKSDGSFGPSGTGAVTVIDGSTNTVSATLTVGAFPVTVAVNAVTNQAYVVNLCGDTTTGCDSSTPPEGSISVIDGAAELASTTTMVSANNNPQLAGKEVTFTATVTSASAGTPTGTVAFYDGSTELGTGMLNSSAAATYQTSSLAVGSHSITAVYSGDANFAGSTSAALVETINAATAAATTLAYSGPVAFTDSSAANLSAVLTQTTGGSPVAGASVLFTLGNGGNAQTCSGTTASNGTATCSITSVSQPSGADTLSASFAGNSNDLASSAGPISVTITAATVQVAVGTSPAGLSFSVDGTTYTATQTLSWTVGSIHTIATSSPQTNIGTQNTFASWSDGGTISHSVSAPSTATSYTASFSTSYQLTTAASPASGGTVTPASGNYYASGTVVSLAATPNSGYTFTGWTGSVASISSSTTTIKMSAPESATANFAAVTPASFTVSSTTTAQTIQPGGFAQYAITVTAQNGTFSSAVTLAASGLPAGATATFSPASVTPGNSSASSTLTIQTAETTAASTPKNSRWPLGAPVLALACLFFLPDRRSRRRITLGLWLLASMGAFAALTACGGGFGMGTAKSAAMNYSITVIGTSGSVQQSTTVQLTVE